MQVLQLCWIFFQQSLIHFFKKSLQYRSFLPVKFAKFLTVNVLKNIYKPLRLALNIIKDFLIQFLEPRVLEILSFTKKLMNLKWEEKHLQPQQKLIWRLMSKMAYLHLLKFWEWYADDVCSILTCTHLETISITSKIFIKIIGLLWRKKMMEN